MKTSEYLQRIVLLTIISFLLTSARTRGQDTDLLKWKYARTASSGTVFQMETDSIGNLYILGTFFSGTFSYGDITVTGPSGNDETNVFLMKLAANGELLWLKSCYGEGSSAQASPVKMAVNDKGEMAVIFTVYGASNVLVGNKSITTDGGNTTDFVTKISKTGFVVYIERMVSESLSTPDFEAKDLFIDEEGSVFLTGYFQGSTAFVGNESVPGTEGDFMLFVSRLDSRGSVEWIKNCAWEGDNGSIYPLSLVNTSRNFFYVGGYYSGNRNFIFGNDTAKFNNTENAFAACYGKDGTALWSRAFRGDQEDRVQQMAAADDGRLYILGSFNSKTVNTDQGGSFHSASQNNDLFIGAISPGGLVVKAISLGTGYLFNWNFNAHIGIAEDQNPVVCADFYDHLSFDDGTDIIHPAPDTSDMLVVKLDSVSLHPLWILQATSSKDNRFEGVKIDRYGHVLFGGTANQTLTVNGESVPVNESESSPYLVRLLKNGTVDYAFSQHNSGNDRIEIHAVSSDKYGNSFIAGSFAGINTLEDLPVDGATSGLLIAKYSRIQNLSGLVVNEEEMPVDNGKVKIFGYTQYQRSPLNDTVLLNVNGTFTFTDIPYGTYILTAIPGEALAGEYIPTYYPDKEYWEFADQVVVDQNATNNQLIITMQSAGEASGGSQFTGEVSDAEEADILKSTSQINRKPRNKAVVILAGTKHLKSTYEFLAVTETDAEGNFAFSNIEDGGYYLWVDEPGLPTENAYFIEVTGGQYVSSLNYLVGEEKVIGVSIPVISGMAAGLENTSVSIAPNPVTDNLIITLDRPQTALVNLFNAKGKRIKHVTFASDTKTIDMSALKPGNYFIRVMTEEEIVFKKITVVR